MIRFLVLGLLVSCQSSKTSKKDSDNKNPDQSEIPLDQPELNGNLLGQINGTDVE